MSCNIYIKLGKEEQTIISDAELDSFLRSHSAQLSKIYKIEEFDKTFSMSEEQDVAIQKVNHISDIFKNTDKKEVKTAKKHLTDREIIEDLEEYDYAESVKNSMSISKYVEFAGNRHNIEKAQVTGTNKDYELKFKQKLRDEGLPEQVIEKAWAREQFKGELAARSGDDVHYILETKFRQISDPSISIDTSKFVVLTEEDFKQYEPLFDKIVDSIKERFPDAQFFPEFSVVSQTLPSAMVSVLNKKAGIDPLGANAIKTLNGRIDLLVIDKDGVAHVFDWKTSSKRIGSWKEMDNRVLANNNWWTSTKKLKAFCQSGNYGAMLEQYGLTVDAPEIVPIYMEFDKDADGQPIKKILDIQLDSVTDGTNCSPYTMRELRTGEYTFSVTKPIEVKNLKKIGDICNNIFPGTNIGDAHTKHFEATVEYYKNDTGFLIPIQKGTKEAERGYKWKFYQNNLPDKSPVFIRDEKDLDEKIAKYVEDVNNFVSNQIVNFATDLAKVTYNHGQDDSLIETWLSSFTENQSAYLKNQFRKYYKNGWQLTVNTELNNNGIFLFKKADQIDIVVLSEKDLHHIFSIMSSNGKLAHTVLGAKLTDDRDMTDQLGVMSSQYGNLLLMKVAALISQNPELINGARINTIKVINPWHRSEVIPHSQNYFRESWNRIVQLNPELHLRYLPENMFFDDDDVCLHEASEAMLSEDLEGFADTLTANSSQKLYDEDLIKRLMKRIRLNHPGAYEMPEVKSRSNVTVTKIQYAYHQLQLALMHLQGVHVYDEIDRGKYFNKGPNMTGTYVVPAGQSKSVNVRAMDVLFTRYRDLYTTMFNEQANPFVNLRQAVFDEWGYDERIGRPIDFWKNFIETDDEGNVLKEMLLKRPTHPDFEGKEKSKELVQLIANTLAQYRFRNKSEEELDELYDKNKYWELPLLEAGVAQTIRDSYNRGGLKGLAEGFWQHLKNVGVSLESYYLENQNDKIHLLKNLKKMIKFTINI